MRYVWYRLFDNDSKFGNPFDRRHHALVVALLFVFTYALDQFVGLWLLSSPPLMDDARHYAERALQLWRGAVDDKPHYWPPGGPYVLWAVFSGLGQGDFDLVQMVMPAVVASTSVFVYFLACELTGNVCMALVASTLFALNPTTLLMARQSESHVFCAFWVGLLAWQATAYMRRDRLYMFLLAVGAANALLLTRPGSVLILGALMVLPLARWWAARFRWASMTTARKPDVLLCTALGVVLTVAMQFPTLAFNHAKGAGWVISINNERNFFLGNNPYTHPYKTGHLAWRPLEKLPDEVRAYLHQHYEAERPRDAMRASAFAYVLSEPMKFLQRSANRFVNFWTFDYEQGIRMQRFLASRGHAVYLSWLPVLVQAIFSVLLIWGVLMSLPALLRGRYRLAVAGLLLVCFLYQAPHVVAFSSPVYRAGLAPLLSVMSALGLWAWLRRMPKKQEPAKDASVALPWAYVASVSLLVVGLNAQAAYYLVSMH